MEGIRVKQMLHRKHIPKTMAKGVRLLREATRPPQVKDLGQVEAEINKWEKEVKLLGTQWGEGFSKT
eukprot:10021138-Lingulodinium_polyedra.AAC.2